MLWLQPEGTRVGFVFMAFLPSPHQEQGFRLPPDWGSVSSQIGRVVTGRSKHLSSHLFLGPGLLSFLLAPESLCYLISCFLSSPQPSALPWGPQSGVLPPALLAGVQMDAEGTLVSHGRQAVRACY